MTSLVVTCKNCRAWYNQDMEYGLDDDHFDFRTGEPCHAEDDEWHIVEIEHRSDWYYAN